MCSRHVVEALLNDEVWRLELEKAETFNEVVKVFVEFAKSRGIKVKEV